MLAEAVERSLAYTAKKEMLLTGGVAANKVLQEKLDQVVKLHDAISYVVKSPYTGDNGSQIAWTGVLAYRAGVGIRTAEARVKPKWRMEDVDIPWRTTST
jgi:N6-L-threonylcarbamoyladenine synthase